MDLAEESSELAQLLGIIHDYFRREAEAWCNTNVDALFLMDDWGSQRSLLISPAQWRAIFKPLYKEYCDIARAHGKKVFMHSDGHIFEIYEDLIELGVDAINSQLFCMDIEQIGKRFKGRISFWGEIDRQNVLPSPNPEVGRAAVRTVAQHLYDPAGGVIAQFELGAGANIAVARAIYEEWERVGT
jgi:uroporphyrinogen-III decarboxylase